MLRRDVDGANHATKGSGADQQLMSIGGAVGKYHVRSLFVDFGNQL
jgi:hypothetical protein